MGYLQRGDGACVRVGELADQFSRPGPHVRVRVRGQVRKRRSKDSVGAGRASIVLTPVTGQGVKRGDTHSGVGVVGHGDQLVHGLGVDQVIEQAAATLAHGGIGVVQARPDGAERILPAPQQLVIGRDSALRVAKAGDERIVVSSDKAEHEPECGLAHATTATDYPCAAT